MSNLVRLLTLCIVLGIFFAPQEAYCDGSFNHCQESRSHEPPISRNEQSLAATFAGALDSGQILWPLLLALVAGLLTALSPCVYPLIPITLSIMGARAYETHLHGFLVACSYVLGMSIVYSVLGAIFASLGLLAGSIMQSPFILIIFAFIFLLMALAMLGAFEFVVPTWLLTKLHRIGGRGFKGAFLMGLVAGVIAAPCTGPVLGAILAIIAYDQNLVLGVLLMSSFSLGLGLPFLGLGAFSSVIAHLPKSGSWMNSIKLLLGSAMLAASIYYLAEAAEVVASVLIKVAQLGTTMLVFIVVVGIIFLILSPKVKLFTVLGAGLFSSALAAMLFSLGLNLAPQTVSSENLSWYIIDDKIHNQGYFDELLAQADQSCKPVLIDFYADWCIACRELSSLTFTDQAVQQRLGSFFLIKVDASRDSSLLSAIHRRFNITGLPAILVLDRSLEHIPQARIMGFVSPEKLLLELKDF